MTHCRINYHAIVELRGAVNPRWNHTGFTLTTGFDRHELEKTIRVPAAPINNAASENTFVDRDPWHNMKVPETASLAPNNTSSAPAKASKSNKSIDLLLVLGIVFLVGFISAGLWLIFYPPEDYATITFATKPEEATVFFDGKPVPVSTSPFVIPNVSAGEKHTIRIAKEGYAEWSMQVRVKPRQDLNLHTINLHPKQAKSAGDAETPSFAASKKSKRAARKSKRRALATASQAAQPSKAQTTARITLGDIARRTQPSKPAAIRIKQAKQTEPTDNKATLPSPAKNTAVVASTKEAAATPTEKVAAKESEGTLRINTRPWTSVIVDGQSMGNTPLLNLRLPAGVHQVKLVNQEFGLEKTMTIKIQPGKTVTRVFDMSEPRES